MPKIYQVNWFRRDVNEDGSAGKFLWPGFGDNARVLKWIVERLDGKVDAIETPVGLVPRPEDIDTTGLDMADDDVVKALKVDVEDWRKELPMIEEWFAKFGDKLPKEMELERQLLVARLERSPAVWTLQD